MGATTVCFLSTVSPELMDRGKSPLLIYQPSCTLRVMSSAVTFAYLRVLERTEELSPFLRVYGILFSIVMQSWGLASSANARKR